MTPLLVLLILVMKPQILVITPPMTARVTMAYSVMELKLVTLFWDVKVVLLLIAVPLGVTLA